MAFTIDDNNDGFEVADDFQMTTKIMVFGVGGAGGNAVAHMVDSGIQDVEYVIANTDVAALRGKDGSKMKRIQIGRKTTKGQGAGNDPAKGRDSAEENREDIEKAMDGVSMLFIAAGMGGGTGTGAAPVVASVAKEKDILTVGVVTKPFGWEGTSKMRQAIGGISEMKKYVDALIVIPNDRLKELKSVKITLKNAFSEVDNILCKAVMGIIKLLQGDGHINVDFADVKMALSDSGIAHMAIGHGKGDYKIDEALDEVLNSPLLETSINGARRGLLNISVPSTLSFEEFDTLTQDIAEKFNSDARYKFGVVFDDSLAEDEISLIVVATDFEEEASSNPLPNGFAASADPEPVASVTVTPTSDGFSGNVGFASGASDIDLLLQKFNSGRD